MTDHSALIERLEAVEEVSDLHGGPAYALRDLLDEAAAALRDLTEWRDFAQSIADVPIEREALNYTITKLRFGRGALAKETKTEAVVAVGTLRDILTAARRRLPLPSAPNQAKEAGE